MGRYIVGVSGASGSVLALRLISFLVDAGHSIDLIMSDAAVCTASCELSCANMTPKKFISNIKNKKLISICDNNDVSYEVSSGSCITDAMIIVPCSMNTVAAISNGLSNSALLRAADVTLKERRPLIIVPRETPLHAKHLENMLNLCRLGAVLVPPMPSWYLFPKTMEDIEKFIVGRVLDMLKIEHDLYVRWCSK